SRSLCADSAAGSSISRSRSDRSGASLDRLATRRGPSSRLTRSVASSSATIASNLTGTARTSYSVWNGLENCARAVFNAIRVSLEVMSSYRLVGVNRTFDEAKHRALIVFGTLVQRERSFRNRNRIDRDWRARQVSLDAGHDNASIAGDVFLEAIGGACRS